ncbi:E3 ubiquitin-protein ligase makorin-1-like isoform X2 [Haemaphysalis longicornis]
MAEGGSEGVLCRYFLSGMCRDGQRCVFSHDRHTGVVDNVCRYYLKGECIYGSRCRYDHVRTKPRADGTVRLGGGSRFRGLCQNRSNSAAEGATNGGGASTAGSGSSSSTASRAATTQQTGNGAVKASAKSYAAIVRPEGEAGERTADGGSSSAEALLPLCPYEVSNNGCPMADCCTYLHGELCDLCEKPCLHPFNEAQRMQHREECVLRHEQDMELSFAVQRSSGKSCGICMDIVMDKEPPSDRRFGILEKCSHVFCLKCIRKWRNTKQLDSKIVRSCPECRVPSDFVTPSKFWVDMGTEKDKLIADYKTAMSAKPCRYFQEGRGKCPFAGACFYKHMYPDGRRAVMPPPRPRRRVNLNGELEIMERLYLWDFLDVADGRMFAPFNLEDVFEILSETEESDSDWSDIDILLN